MAHTLNFNTIPKKYLTVTLADEKQTTIMIGTPTKTMMTDLISLQTAAIAAEESDPDLDTMDALYTACAKLMSRNKGGIKIEKSFLESIFDFEDIFIFFNAYMEFVTEIANQKN